MEVPEGDGVVVAAEDIADSGADVRQRKAVIGALDVGAVLERVAEGDRDEVVAEVREERPARGGARDEVELAADAHATLCEAALRPVARIRRLAAAPCKREQNCHPDYCKPETTHLREV